MINEKGLVREMKWAYKIMGYTVVDHGAEMSIYTNDWYIHCDKWKIPRKVLATLAEHMGQLTDEGDALRIQKDADLQRVMPTLVGDDISKWVGKDILTFAKQTSVQFEGLRIFQDVKSLDCFGVMDMFADLVEVETVQYSAVTINTDRVAQWKDNGEMVAVRAASKRTLSSDQAVKIWEALEGVNLKRGGYEE